MQRIKESRFDDAWEDLLTIHRLGRLLSRGATLIEGIGSLSLEITAMNAERLLLAAAPFTAAQCNAKLAQLDTLPPRREMAHCIDLAERFSYLSHVQAMRRGTLAVDLPPIECMDCGAWMKFGNPWYDRLAASMRKPTRAERVAAIEKTEADLKALVKSPPGLSIESFFDALKTAPEKVTTQRAEQLLLLFLPNVGEMKVQSVEDQVTQQIEMHRTALALAAYRAARGAYPAKIEDLVPKFLARLPGDLYSGKPLQYRIDGDGYVLYSVFENGKDDEGRGKDDLPKGDDLNIRMPQVKK